MLSHGVPTKVFPLATLVLVLGGGCNTQPAPDDVDALTRFLWARFEPAEGSMIEAQEAELRDAATKLAGILAELDAPDDAPVRGTISPLTSDDVSELEGVGDRASRVDDAQGFVYAGLTGCSMAQLVSLALSERAIEIHPGVYESYEKEFASDKEPFASGGSDLIRWTLTYKTAPESGGVYTAKLSSAARRVAAAGDVGELLLLRSHLVAPATFEDDGSSFDLEFRQELIVDRGDGTLAHLISLWRAMSLGGLDSKSPLYIDGTLSSFVQFEGRVEAACAEGRL